MPAFDVTTRPTSLYLEPGTTGSIVVIVSNRLGRPVMGLIDGKMTPGSAATWLIAPPRSEAERRLDADPAATAIFEFKVVVPRDAASQVMQFTAIVRDVMEPDDTMVEGQTVAITVGAVAAPTSRPRGSVLGWILGSLEHAKDAITHRKGTGASPRPKPTLTRSMPPSEPPAEQPVLLGASAPSGVPPGAEFTARLVAYVKELEESVRANLAGLSPRSESHLGLKTCRWQTGTTVTVRLSGTGLTVEPAAQEFAWSGEQNMVDFDVTVAADAPVGVTILKFDALVDGIIVARLRLDLAIRPGTAEATERKATVAASSTAFASYASQDRERVLDRVAAVRIGTGMDIFLDCMSLRPGEQWKPALENEIRSRELFLLFWSSHARESPWVSWEWRTALRDKGLDAIQLHPLETVVEAQPPEELEQLHFGDAYMLAREASRRVRPEPSSKPSP